MCRVILPLDQRLSFYSCRPHRLPPLSYKFLFLWGSVSEVRNALSQPDQQDLSLQLRKVAPRNFLLNSLERIAGHSEHCCNHVSIMSVLMFPITDVFPAREHTGKEQTYQRRRCKIARHHRSIRLCQSLSHPRPWRPCKVW